MTAASSSSSERRPPLVELRGLGVWYRLHRRGPASFKHAVLRGGLGRHEVHWALRGVDLECREGEALGVIGPNGAGKTTLCLTLAGILTPDEGTATIRGTVSTLLTLGAGFNRELSGRANIQLYAAFLGIPRREIRRKMDEIIDFSELGAFIDEPIRAYSNGMRARLGFSVASALEPDILILDEVLGVGDRAFRSKSEARLREMMAGSRLIVIVSHSMSTLRSVCTHGLWLERGTTRRFGPAEEVLAKYEEASDRGKGD